VVAIALCIFFRLIGSSVLISNLPLYLAFAFGGVPLVFELCKKAFAGEFGSDLLAGISIVTSLILGEYLAGVFVILMLSGGEAVEAYALRRASSVLDALAKRMPNLARRRKDGVTTEVSLQEIQLGDTLEILPHDICPVDGLVLEGKSSMDESYLTGEPYQMPKAPGSDVLSGAINGETLLLIQATALPIDSRYQKIAKVIELQAGKQVPMRRLGDTLGSWYTPLALAIAGLAWMASHDATRFLSVLVVATPCPLLIAIPVAIIGAISAAARRGIIVKNPAALERTSSCKTMILDKTGTLTYGEPALTEFEVVDGINKEELLGAVTALEGYSKHPLAEAIRKYSRDAGVNLPVINSISEKPGEGLKGICNGKEIAIVGRKHISALGLSPLLQKPGLECHILVNGSYAGILRFRDTPRVESRGFVDHLGLSHGINKVMILSGDREQEVRHLAQLVGISEIKGGMSPEEKLVRVIEETRRAPTLYLGDGINDAPSLQAATVGIALGTKSDITSEAADIVILEQSLVRVDEFFHISVRMKKIAVQSAVGGMALSVLGMIAAAFGLITPLAGAITQEFIDVAAVLNALRTSANVKIPHHQLGSQKASVDFLNGRDLS